jgi:hypothetical protein
MTPLRAIGQLAAYGAFVTLLGCLEPGPAYEHLAPELATVKLSLRHAGALLADCRNRTAAELAQLPPNMRAPQICERERSPLQLELRVNDAPVYAETLPPRGLHNDGRVSVYRRIPVPAGPVHVAVRLKDDVRADGYQYAREATLTLAPAEVLVIDFDEHAEEFTFRMATPAVRPAESAG